MKIKNHLLAPLSLIIVSIFAVLFPGCERDKFNEEALDEYLKTLPSIASEMPVEKAPVLKSTSDEKTSEYIYHYDYYEAAAGFDEQIVLNPQTDVIYPGALIRGNLSLMGLILLSPLKGCP